MDRDRPRFHDGTPMAKAPRIRMILLTWLQRLLRGAALPALGIGLLSLNGCTPQTKYRYTGYVPAARALAWDGRTAKDGTLRVEGTMSMATVHRNLDPQPHDTALRVPDTTLEGAAFLAITNQVEIGARYSYAAYAWGEPTAVGTMPLPSRPSVWGVGPEIRATLNLDKRKEFAIGVAANIMRYETPYAEWENVPGGCTISATCVLDPYAFNTGGRTSAYYRLNGERSESHLTLNIAVYPSVALGKDAELGHVFGGFAVHSTFKNDGFTDIAQNGSTIQDAGLIYIAGLGYSIMFEPLRLSAMMTLPLTSSTSSVNYGVSGFFTLGIDFSLWESREDRRRRLDEEERRRMPRPQAPAPQPSPTAPPAPTSGERAL
jgi:hypothetical protein